MTPAHRREQTKDVSLINAGRFSSPLTSFIALTLLGGPLHAQENRDLTSMSVDDLMNVGLLHSLCRWSLTPSCST